jgi:hypothetical protein
LHWKSCLQFPAIVQFPLTGVDLLFRSVEEEGEREGRTTPPRRKQVRFRSQAQFWEAASLFDEIDGGGGAGTTGGNSGGWLRPALAPEPVFGPPVRLRSGSLTEPSITLRARAALGQAAASAAGTRLKPAVPPAVSPDETRAKTIPGSRAISKK